MTCQLSSPALAFKQQGILALFALCFSHISIAVLKY